MIPPYSLSASPTLLLRPASSLAHWPLDRVQFSPRLSAEAVPWTGSPPEASARSHLPWSAPHEEADDAAVDAASEDITALLVAVTLCLEAVGPLSLSAVVASSLLLASTGLLPEGLPLSWSLSDAAPWAPLVCAAVASEAAFYLACIAAAHLSSSTLGHAPGAARPGVRAWPEERRAALWRRILTDSSTTPHDFVAEWMYREGSGATSPAALLAEWAARRVGLSKGRKGRAAELSAGGVAYSDLCVGDVYDWLAATFFGASRADLTPAQAPPPHVALICDARRSYPASRFAEL